ARHSDVIEAHHLSPSLSSNWRGPQCARAAIYSPVVTALPHAVRSASDNYFAVAIYAIGDGVGCLFSLRLARPLPAIRSRWRTIPVPRQAVSGSVGEVFPTSRRRAA